jgi:hypothetical protein
MKLCQTSVGRLPPDTPLVGVPSLPDFRRQVAAGHAPGGRAVVFAEPDAHLGDHIRHDPEAPVGEGCIGAHELKRRDFR